MPVGRKVARTWAETTGYPFADPTNLPEVAQYLAVVGEDRFTPKQRMVDEYGKLQAPDFSQGAQPHGVLASLPFTMYVTTNYDDFMAEALRRAGTPRPPVVKVAPWTESRAIPPELRWDEKDVSFTWARPLVFHLHGHFEAPDSMVLTDDDYVDFLVKLGEERNVVLPEVVQGAFADSLLFIGYRLVDWNFRVIHRALIGSRGTWEQPLHVTVQLDPTPTTRRST
jgi:hypothetical protein